MLLRFAAAVTWCLAISIPGSTDPLPVRFDGGSTFAIGSQSRALTCGDFDEDGWIDAAIISDLAAEGSVLLNTGDGGLTRQALTWVDGASGVVAEDVDGDEHLDLLVSSNDPNTPGLFLRTGDGAGGFSALTNLYSALPLVALGSGLFDSNSDVDLFAVRPLISQDVIVFLNDGMGGFTASTWTVGGVPVTAKAGELNGDPHLDLVVLLETNSLVFLFGDGMGGFTVSSPTNIASGASDVCIGDYDGDTNNDLVTTHGEFVSPIKTQLRLGDGKGAFDPPQDITPDYPMRATEVTPAFVDGDTSLDLLFSSPGSIGVLYGEGDGSFTDLFKVAPGCGDPELVDVDQDGNPDILALGEDRLAVLWGDPNRILEGTRSYPLPEMETRSGVVIDDFDGDGTADVVSLSGEFLHLSSGLGNGELAPATEIFSGVFDGLDLRTNDFNEDGDPDILATRVFVDRVTVIRSDGNGGFFPPVTSQAGGFLENGVVVGDFDEQDGLDVCVALADDKLAYLFNDDTALPRFDAPVVVQDPALQFGPRPVAVGDLDDDQHLDIIVARQSSLGGERDRITVLRGDGAGGFTVFQHLTLSNEGPVALVDLNDDDDLDLLVAERFNLVRFLGNGDATFGPREVLLSFGGAGEIVTGDFNGDSILDVVTRGSGGFLQCAVGDGMGGFVAGPIDALLDGPFACADLDEDGALDLAVLTSDSGLWTHLNRSQFLACREGNVTGQQPGEVVDVLFLNGSAGHGDRRRLRNPAGSPLTLSIEAAPNGGSRFAIYAWRIAPTPFTLSSLPSDLGCICMPIPFHSPTGAERAAAIWKTVVDFDAILGMATHPSSPAPSTLFSVPSFNRVGDYFFQGVIVDGGSPGGGALTNGIQVRVR